MNIYETVSSCQKSINAIITFIHKIQTNLLPRISFPRYKKKYIAISR